MAKRFNKDRYISSDSYTVSVEDLSSRSRQNLQFLRENLSIDFDDQATVIPVRQVWSGGEVKGLAKSFIIEGIGPDGEEMVFFRKETKSPGAGQTYLYIDGQPFQIGYLRESLDPKAPKITHPISGEEESISFEELMKELQSG